MQLRTLRYTNTAFESNRLYIMQHPDYSATVVDPASADEVLDFLNDHGLNLPGILVTHHHADHTDGIAGILKVYPDSPVIVGSGLETHITQATHILGDWQELTIGDTRLRAIATPGHTLTHYVYATDQGVLFAGDCLFRLGCGRLFEGTPDMMWTSILRIRALPDNTLVCCGHDYVVDNAKFSLQVMPGDQALIDALEELVQLESDQRLPFLLGDDKKSNLFLRADEPAVMEATGKKSSRDCFAGLRLRRDSF